MRMRNTAIVLFFLVESVVTVVAQAPNMNDYAITYGVNYSSADRKKTQQPSVVGPASAVYRVTCYLLLGADDDTFVSNKTATGRDTGIGDLAFEAHLRFWNYGNDGHGNCDAGKKISWTLDYVVTVPVGATLESTELVHQTKVSVNKPYLVDGKLKADLFANAGLTSAGLSTGGSTQNALASANYARYVHPGGNWGGEVEMDLQSASKKAPSSAVVLFAIDGAFDKAGTWGLRFGTSIGVTPYAPKVSPFIQITYNGHANWKSNSALH